MAVQTTKDGWELSNKAMKITSLLSSCSKDTSSGKSSKRVQVSYSSDQHSAIQMAPRHPDRPAFDVQVIVDPVSQGAQKAGTLLRVLHKVLNARIRVFLNCVDKHSELPQKSYFR